MASACVNNMSVSPESFPGKPYGWLSPGVSFGREYPNDGAKVAATKQQVPPLEVAEVLDLEVSTGDFEFRLEDPVGMLPADELFFDGKLVPLHISSLRPTAAALVSSPVSGNYRRREAAPVMDPYLFSPKAPRCSSRWRELLGLKKLHQNSTTTTGAAATASLKNGESVKTSSFSGSSSKSLKNFLHRSSKSLTSSDAYLSLPLLKETDIESVSVSSSRLSLSSSSSGHDHDDHRLSLDSDKTAPNPFKAPNPPRMRFVRPTSAATPTATSRAGRSPMRRAAAESAASRGTSVDSPRMNSSGKIVFQSLERSSSSPSSFNGGPRLKNRGMERSYSANVRVTPVLNVPVFGLGQLFTPQKRDNNGVINNSTRASHHYQNRNRTEKFNL